LRRQCPRIVAEGDSQPVQRQNLKERAVDLLIFRHAERMFQIADRALDNGMPHRDMAPVRSTSPD